MYIVIAKPEYTPNGNKAVGIGVAYAIFNTRKEALEWQLANGLRKETEIFDDSPKRSNSYD